MRRELEVLLDRTESARAEVRLQMGEIAHATQRVLEERRCRAVREDQGADANLWTNTGSLRWARPPRPFDARTGETGRAPAYRGRPEQSDPRFFTFLVERTSLMASALTSVAKAADAVSGTFGDA